jgi:hypothetical protein
MSKDGCEFISRRSLLLQALMLVPLWQVARLPDLSGKTSPAALPPGDEFVEVNGWIPAAE